LDRTITYTGAVPRSQDFLQAQKDGIYALAYFAQAILGQPSQIFPGVTAWIDGLVCSPVAPPSLQISVGGGSIYMMEQVDANPYGVLGVDTNIALKQGLLLQPQVLNITPPTTSGYSQYYLVQANYNDIDGGSVVLPYLNSANLLIPLGGPANSGQAQFTIRQGACVIALKPGVAAPSGSQVIPPADPGFTPLWTILVSNGQTQILSGNIAQVANAPFISPKLTQVPPAIQAQKDNYAVDTSTAIAPNAMAITLPAFTNVVAGLTLRVIKSAFKNTAGPTLSINGGVPVTIAWADGNALRAGDWPAGGIGQITYNGSFWELYSFAGPSLFPTTGAGPTVTDASLLHYGVDTGTANAAVCAAVTPTITTTVSAGVAIEVQKIGSANTGSMTLAITATGGTVTAPLFWADGNALQAGDWPAGALAVCIFDGTVYRLISVTKRPITFPEGAYVHYGVASGQNTLTTTTTPLFTAITDGIFLELTPTQANTGPVTLAANGLTATAVQTIQGNNLSSGQLQPNQPVLMMALGGIWKLFGSGGIIGGGGGLTNIQVLTSSGTYVPTTGAQKALVFATGGGGGGGVALSCGGGGGAGATAIALVPLVGVSSIGYTIGAGGIGVQAAVNGNSTGGTGGTTTFGSYASAGGGLGGPGAVGGSGGQASLGAMLIQGGEGGRAVTDVILGSAAGGSSFWGGGGQGSPTTNGQGNAGTAYGSGGGGGDSGYSIRTGGNGKAGVILVVEF
jgi:hypothetical protein